MANGKAAPMSEQLREARVLWNQTRIPVVFRPPDGSIKIRLPYAEGNKDWLRDVRRNKPKWDPTGKYWTIPRSWFDDFIKRTLARFGSVYVIQPYRELQKCAPACWNATGFECECSCMGAHHGSQTSEGWREIGETFAVRWGDRQLACRLINRKG